MSQLSDYPGGNASETDCPGSGSGQPQGAPGGTLAILARQAIVSGTISARGGDGLNGGDNCLAKYNANVDGRTYPCRLRPYGCRMERTSYSLICGMGKSNS